MIFLISLPAGVSIIQGDNHYKICQNASKIFFFEAFFNKSATSFKVCPVIYAFRHISVCIFFTKKNILFL